MKHITVDQLKARIDAGEKLNILDVREDVERSDFNIGGTHIRLGRIQEMAIDDIEDLKDEEVIIYCRSGNRSQVAAHILEQLGFKNTVNVTGGMLDWVDKFGR
ncbi:MAG TPA: rhodanese-like domain-containing protein [Segetibacter sp.]|nr:rhodanese-like domain-containing protein [Segetibacter sp.]